MNYIHVQYFDTPCGELILGSYDQKLCLCDWRYRSKRDAIDFRLKNNLEAQFVERDSLVLQDTKTQLYEYFRHKRTRFDIPLRMVGTPFQKTVWTSLLNIPFGETASYLQLAEAVGDRKAVRAVANANGANAISIIIPCHRVIGSSGQLVGYAGGLRAKTNLLELECEPLAALSF